MKLSAVLWMCDESLDGALTRVARAGLHGVEIDADVDAYEVEATKRLLDRHGLVATGTVAQMANPGRDLVNPDRFLREATEAYLRAAIEFTGAIGAQAMVLVPSQIGKTTPLASADEEWTWAVEGLQRLGAHAQEAGVKIAIEPITRGETYFVTVAAQAIRLAQDVGMDSVGVCLDTANMYAEDRDPVAAIEAAGDLLVDFHVADSNRRAVGEGVVDWPAILGALERIGYDGPIGVELLSQHDRSPLREPGASEDADMFKMTGDEFEQALRATAGKMAELAEAAATA